VKQAVVILGLDTLKSLVVATAAIDMFADDRIEHGFQDYIWRHSLVTASGSRLLMRSVHPNDIGLCELAFTAGVLHDIGKMVMLLRSPSEYQAIIQRASEDVESRLELEREHYACDHATAGQCLTTQWQLPDELCQSIGHHHAPGSHDDPHHLTDVLHVANGLAHHVLAAPNATAAKPSIDPSVFERCGLKVEALGDYFEQVKQEYAKAETFLNIARAAA
jgi:HD-like signal output (HDOD) protein